MSTLQDLREKYPQYSDMSDEQLARGFHDKYYADMPFDQFAQKIGYQQTPKPSTSDNVLRQVALTGRNIGQGVLNTLASPYDAVMGSVNFLGGKLDQAVFGRQMSPDYPTFSGTLERGLNEAGAPVPETQNEQTAARYVQTGAGLATGLGIGNLMKAGASSPAVRQFGESLASNPALQTVSAATGATAADIAQRAGAGPTGQTIAGLVGTALPSGGAAGLAAVTRGAVRGGAAGGQQMRNAVDQAREAGTTLTLGEASGNRAVQAVEKSMDHVKGSQGIMAANEQRQIEQIGARMESVANRNDALASPTTAGQGVSEGIFGKDIGWLDRSRTVMNNLYQKLDQVFSPRTRVQVSNTQEMLKQLNKPIDNAENISRDQFLNADIQGIEKAVIQDITRAPLRGTLPIEALKKLRTAVGEQLDDPTLSNQVKANKYRPLYEAITKDMEAAYSGNADAAKAWRDANSYTADRHEVVDMINRSVSKDVPEQIFNTLVSGAKNGDTVLKAVLDRIPEQARQVFADTVLKRLGRTGHGESVADAGPFDTQKFIDNWNALSPEAKQTLFGSVSTPMRRYINSVTSTIERMQAGSEVSAAHMPSSSFKDALRLGASATGLPILAAKAATNPNVVDWFAQATRYKQTPAAFVAAGGSPSDSVLFRRKAGFP